MVDYVRFIILAPPLHCHFESVVLRINPRCKNHDLIWDKRHLLSPISQFKIINTFSSVLPRLTQISISPYTQLLRVLLNAKEITNAISQRCPRRTQTVDSKSGNTFERLLCHPITVTYRPHAISLIPEYATLFAKILSCLWLTIFPFYIGPLEDLRMVAMFARYMIFTHIGFAISIFNP